MQILLTCFRYIIATQDRELQQKCRKITGVPLLYFHLKVPVLEAPSSLTQSTINYKSLNDFQIKEFEKKKLSKLSLEADDVKPIQRKRKLKGGPNPLSCKKKQKKDQSDVIKKSEVKAKKKKSRKRNRSNLLKKIKNEVKATLQV